MLLAGSNKYYDARMIRGEVSEDTTRYLTDVITNDAIGFIEEQVNKDVPFYINVNYNAPHRPWINNHPKEIVDSYDNCAFNSCP